MQWLYSHLCYGLSILDFGKKIVVCSSTSKKTQWTLYVDRVCQEHKYLNVRRHAHVNEALSNQQTANCVWFSGPPAVGCCRYHRASCHSTGTRTRNRLPLDHTCSSVELGLVSAQYMFSAWFFCLLHISIELYCSASPLYYVETSNIGNMAVMPCYIHNDITLFSLKKMQIKICTWNKTMIVKCNIYYKRGKKRKKKKSLFRDSVRSYITITKCLDILDIQKASTL